MGITQIKEWQKIIGVNADGDFGPATLAKSKEVAEKAGILKPVEQGETGAHWMAIARGEIGTKEKKGGENPRIIEYHSITTLSAKADEVPWCSAFVSWCLEKVGYKSTKNAWARSYESYGNKLSKPQVNCIVVFDWKNGSGHVGFVTDFNDTTVSVLGGNQSDSVNITSFGRKNVSAWRWPVK